MHDPGNNRLRAQPAKRSQFPLRKHGRGERGSERGVIVFAASTGRQLSIEDPKWGNGAFTKALVEGLGSAGAPAKAKIAGRNSITPAMLEVYVAGRVDDLTGGSQTPVMTSTAPEFPFVR